MEQNKYKDCCNEPLKYYLQQNSNNNNAIRDEQKLLFSNKSK